MTSVLKEVNKVCPQVADSMTDLTAQHANCTSVSTQATAELASTMSGTSEELAALREQVSLQPQLIILYWTPPPAFQILLCCSICKIRRFSETGFTENLKD